MNGATPARRGPGGFPATPQQPWNRSPGARSPNTSTPASTPSRPNVRSPIQDVPRAAPPHSGPVIPADILDPAQQRFYLFAVYIALWAYRSYDFYTLAVEEDESLWLCLKWCFFDMIFMFGVPLLEIPWLEWSNGAAFLLFVTHAALDVMLMFRIGIPVQAWAVGLVGFLWDSELAISERSVKPGSILHNASLILGKQIVNILPEGSAILNPNKESFCLNSTVTYLEIPIMINQTEPIEMQLLRIDFDTNANETITIQKNELGKMLKKARKFTRSAHPDDPLTIRYTVKKPGVYLLSKVTDHSKLQVRPRAASVIVASCPQARVKPTGDKRCRNDLSNVRLEAEGTPPLNIKYQLSVNGKPRGVSEFHGLQPEDAVSPLTRHTSQALVKHGREDVSWARSQKVSVPLNETLSTSGRWEYEVIEVRDGLGNVVNFRDVDDDERPKAKFAGLRQSFDVQERPKAYLRGCDPSKPLRVAKGEVARLPVHYGSTGKQAIDGQHTIEYLFTPETEIVTDGYQSPNAVSKKQTMRNVREQPLISEAGLYTIKAVSTDTCEGEVLEPASCLLQNPPEPGLSLTSEDIVDRCAGNPIGLRVGIDLIGSPPFVIKYTEHNSNNRRKIAKELNIPTLRSTADFTPQDAGHYKYTFESIRDSVYKDTPLRNFELQQNVRPSAKAFFVDRKPRHVCIDDSVDFDVKLSGEAPWKLEYEVVHNGKRVKRTVETAEEYYTIRTDKLRSGGEYIVTLASISDKMGCKEYLKEEAKVNVRHERPKAYFGHIEGKQTIMALEGRSIGLPLRFTGNAPWRLEYEVLETKDVRRGTFNNANALLDAKTDGTYHLLSVKDAVCPGLIEEKADQFLVQWVARPKLTVSESDVIAFDGSKYVKEPVCEGDEDALEVSLHGNAPFDVSYQTQQNDPKGKLISVRNKDLHVAGGQASIRSETAQAGTYEYTFKKLSDSRYDHSNNHFPPVSIKQTVHPRPSARFDKPGKTYSYCSRESEGEEVIPISLEGVAPFYLEVEIKHHGTPKPEISIHKNIPTNKYDLKIEHRKLHLGHSSISIRKVRDSRGCTLKPALGGPRVQISVHDAPAATPLEDRTNYCVGERLSFALGGQVPFTVYYTFEGQERKASNAGTTFRRLAELPGTFTITGLRDSASECLASLDLTKRIHPIPSVRLSGGRVDEIDIHEGGGTDLDFQFWGTPPFEFTYTRSTNAARGKKSKVLEIRTEVSHEMSMRIPIQEEGTYEVVSIKDTWCSFARNDIEGLEKGKGATQKLLQF
ncbi:nucleoporin Pom152 [Didymella exigua CBS 183.55]|uniref:Nucleoporin Pom152 n=1 Tax=Didymella exigua CBS 183.55 TaxID=1150837 RepID=A0A6A5R606_9PLEO|nr:nucleoporin Pom152 [Didymella exigua CBS 183.55]KAF1922630.1 nucleoporin Pom152 [Didymella exigua CBS 183.55]